MDAQSQDSLNFRRTKSNPGQSSMGSLGQNPACQDSSSSKSINQTNEQPARSRSLIASKKRSSTHSLRDDSLHVGATHARRESNRSQDANKAWPGSGFAFWLTGHCQWGIPIAMQLLATCKQDTTQVCAWNVQVWMNLTPNAHWHSFFEKQPRCAALNPKTLS
jgi:hypothetical protein